MICFGKGLRSCKVALIFDRRSAKKGGKAIWYLYNTLLVGGLEHLDYFSIYWEQSNPIGLILFKMVKTTLTSYNTTCVHLCQVSPCLHKTAPFQFAAIRDWHGSQRLLISMGVIHKVMSSQAGVSAAIKSIIYLLKQNCWYISHVVSQHIPSYSHSSTFDRPTFHVYLVVPRYFPFMSHACSPIISAWPPSTRWSP